MPKVSVNLPRPIYNKLCKLAVEGRTIDEIITHASAILIDTIKRATTQKMQTASWFTIASAIDMDYRKLLISFLDQGSELFTSIFEQHFKACDMRECAQTLRVLILLEYLKLSLDNEGIEYLVELRYPPLDEEIKFWQSKGFIIPEKLLFKSESESEAVYQ